MEQGTNKEVGAWKGLSSVGRRRESRGPGTHMPKRVQVIVGELELLEGHKLPHPVCPRGRRVWVHVEATWHGRLGFAGHRPTPRET